MTWKKVSEIFGGGTQEARALKGKKIRSIRPLRDIPRRIDDDTLGEKVTIDHGAAGIVGFVPVKYLDQICLAFPKNRALIISLDAMMRGGQIIVIQVNWETFKHAFEIDI